MSKTLLIIDLCSANKVKYFSFYLQTPASEKAFEHVSVQTETESAVPSSLTCRASQEAVAAPTTLNLPHTEHNKNLGARRKVTFLKKGDNRKGKGETDESNCENCENVGHEETANEEVEMMGGGEIAASESDSMSGSSSSSGSSSGAQGEDEDKGKSGATLDKKGKIKRKRSSPLELLLKRRRFVRASGLTAAATAAAIVETTSSRITNALTPRGSKKHSTQNTTKNDGKGKRVEGDKKLEKKKRQRGNEEEADNRKPFQCTRSRLTY